MEAVPSYEALCKTVSLKVEIPLRARFQFLPYPDISLAKFSVNQYIHTVSKRILRNENIELLKNTSIYIYNYA